MKIRDGFVTNSSSTNFLIISKEELTEAYLLKKLGFMPDSSIRNAGEQLVYSILNSIGYKRVRWHQIDCENPTYEDILEVFGKKSADKFKKLKRKKYDFEFELNNLFNSKYYISASYSDISAYYYRYSLRPRSVLFKVRFKLL